MIKTGAEKYAIAPSYYVENFGFPLKDGISAISLTAMLHSLVVLACDSIVEQYYRCDRRKYSIAEIAREKIKKMHLDEYVDLDKLLELIETEFKETKID
jgi:hypothetical protein